MANFNRLPTIWPSEAARIWRGTRRRFQESNRQRLPRNFSIILVHVGYPLGQIGGISMLANKQHRRRASDPHRATLRPTERGGTLWARNGRSPCPIASC